MKKLLPIYLKDLKKPIKSLFAGLFGFLFILGIITIIILSVSILMISIQDNYINPVFGIMLFIGFWFVVFLLIILVQTFIQSYKKYKKGNVKKINNNAKKRYSIK